MQLLIAQVDNFQFFIATHSNHLLRYYPLLVPLFQLPKLNIFFHFFDFFLFICSHQRWIQVLSRVKVKKIIPLKNKQFIIFFTFIHIPLTGSVSHRYLCLMKRKTYAMLPVYTGLSESYDQFPGGFFLYCNNQNTFVFRRIAPTRDLRDVDTHVHI